MCRWAHGVGRDRRRRSLLPIAGAWSKVAEIMGRGAVSPSYCWDQANRRRLNTQKHLQVVFLEAVRVIKEISFTLFLCIFLHTSYGPLPEIGLWCRCFVHTWYNQIILIWGPMLHQLWGWVHLNKPRQTHEFLPKSTKHTQQCSTSWRLGQLVWKLQVGFGV